MTNKVARTKITSEDCILKEMTGKYDLVFYASQRARAIVGGSPALVEGFDSPKNHSIMVALEEIRQGKLRFDDLMESLASPYIEPVKVDFSEITFKREDFKDDFEDEDEGDDSKTLDYKSEEEYED